MKIKTINQLISVFRDAANRHYQINGFGLGQNWEIGASEAKMHPVLWINPVSATMAESDNNIGYKTFEIDFEIRIFDLVNKDESNENEVLSDGIDILKDIITEFKGHPYYTNSQLNIVNDINFEPFTEEFDEEVTGWVCELSFKTPLINSWCGLPMAEIEGFSFPGADCDGYNAVCDATYVEDVIGVYPIEVTQVSGNTKVISIDTSSLSGDTYVTGGTYSAETITLTRNDNVDISITGISSSIWENSTGTNSAIIKGTTNTAGGTNSISVGNNNAVNDVNGSNSAIIGGVNNTANGTGSFIGGGLRNEIDGSSSATTVSTILGGRDNYVSGDANAIIGGHDNTILSGVSNTIILGCSDITGDTSNTVYACNINTGTLSATTLYGDGSNLTGIDNYYLTGQTFSDNYLTSTLNNGDTIVTEIDNFTGLTVNGSISATTYYGDGSNLTGITSANIYTSNGSLTGNRTVDLNNNTLVFNNGTVKINENVNTGTTIGYGTVGGAVASWVSLSHNSHNTSTNFGYAQGSDGTTHINSPSKIILKQSGIEYGRFTDTVSQLLSQLGVGGTPDASAILDIKSTNKGFLFPRMTSALRIAIVSPATNLIVFDTDLNSLYRYDGTQWVAYASQPAVTITKSDGSVFAYEDFSDVTSVWVEGDIINMYEDYAETTISPNYDIPNGVIINGNGHKFSSATSASGSNNGVFRVQSGVTAYIYNLEFNCGWVTSTGAFFLVRNGGKLVSNQTLLFTAVDATSGTHALLNVQSGGIAGGIRMVIDTPSVNHNQCLKVDGILHDSYFEQKQTAYQLLSGAGYFINCKTDNAKILAGKYHLNCTYKYTSANTGSDTMIGGFQEYYNCTIIGDFPVSSASRIGSYQSSGTVIKMYNCYVSITCPSGNTYLFNRVNTGSSAEKSVFQNCDLISDKRGFASIDETRIIGCNLLTYDFCINNVYDTGEILHSYLYSETSDNIQYGGSGVYERGTLIGCTFEVGDATKNNLKGTANQWYNFKQCTFLGANNPLSTQALITANAFYKTEQSDFLGNVGLGRQANVPSLTTTERDAETWNGTAIIFNESTSKFQGWDGTAWNDFH